MSFENQQESLSAVMDDQADELELRRVLANSDNAELRATWSRYQIARAAMHKELLVPQLDLTQGINAVLDQDSETATAKQGTWHWLGRVAIAASVTLAVLAGVRFYHDTQVGNEQMADAQPTAPASFTSPHEPAVLVGFSEQQVTSAKPALAEEKDILQKDAAKQ